LIKGRWQDFSYKALNILVQGSCSGLTKITMRDFDRVAGSAKLLLTVHDELVCSAPREAWQESMGLLKAIMNRRQLDVPMLSEGYWCENWAERREVA
jgi:DNA polymerase I-like protein with 3'-5' exonuclease and polymerase domains